MRRFFSTSLLGVGPTAWFFFFFIGPLILVLCTSFLSRGTYGGIEWTFQLENYSRLLKPAYWHILVASFQVSFLTTVLCLLIGYPVAWALATAPARHRLLLVSALAIPFFMNLVIRIYGLRLFFASEGPFVHLLGALSIPHDPFAFTQNQGLVFYGMVVSYMPYMIFPLYAALEKFDFSLVEAAADLGAKPLTILGKILIPNTQGAIRNGCLLVFIPCLGEFVIPDLLGGAKQMLIGNLITEQFLRQRDWPFGSAISVALIACLLGSAWVIDRVGRKRKRV